MDLDVLDQDFGVLEFWAPISVINFLINYLVR